MINAIFLSMMAIMGLVGFYYVTFYDGTKDNQDNQDNQKRIYEINCFQFKARYLLFLNRGIERICITVETHLYAWIAGVLSVFFAYFPIAIVEGQVHPSSEFGYTHAFLGDVVGMAVLLVALIIRKGNVAQLLSPRNAKKEAIKSMEKTS